MTDYSHLVTFATPDMERSMRQCRDTALAQGVNQDWPWFQSTLKRTSVYEKNRALFDAPRGAGYWAWKPYIIFYGMAKVPTDCYLIYADAGVEFLQPVQLIIDRMDQDIFLFGNHWPHYAWCKRDIVSAVWPSGPWKLLSPWQDEFFGKQCQASIIFFRVNDYTRSFVKEWLDWCLFEGGRLIDDSPSRLPNHPEFQENRHDQAILTTMAYREGIKLHYWPAVYEGGYVYDQHAEYAADNYPTPMFFHHRRRNDQWERAA